MKNADKPVHPGSVVDPEARRILFDIKNEAEWSAREFRHAVDSFERYAGITKREHFAAMAMQGLCSTADDDGNWTHDPQIAAQAAVQYANALLAELEKETNS